MDSHLESAIKDYIESCRKGLQDTIQTSSEQAITAARETFEKAKSMLNNHDLFFDTQRALYF